MMVRVNPGTTRAASAVAHSNIALAKYWGKLDVERNLPAVPSLSLTLDGLRTVTRVTFDSDLHEDRFTLDGRHEVGAARRRVVALLDRVRALAGAVDFAHVESRNDFPTAAGLASSASGFAALALAATRALGLELDLETVSSVARASSASAARSLFGGFVALAAGAESAVQVAPSDHFDVAMLVAVTASGPKAVGSTNGMRHTQATSPYYASWVQSGPRLFDRVRTAILDRDLPALGAAMEQSALMMHASMMAADPPLIYLAPATLRVMHLVRQLRETGLPAFYTMDAGPHVKVLTMRDHGAAVADALEASPVVSRVLRCGPGPGAQELPMDES